MRIISLLPLVLYVHFLALVQSIDFTQQREADEIKYLPGWKGALPSRQYSGYLGAGNNSDSQLHYWFVEAEDVAPESAPVVLWLNGGPGCSSLDGFFYEMGPFSIVLSDDGTPPQLVLREYRWNLKVNMLFVENPVGVGFSYSKTLDYACSDDRTASEAKQAIEYFYQLFPELKSNNFFLTGESYAGIYVPTIAEAIVNAEIAGTYTGATLTGIAVGNGCTGTEVGICGSGPQGTWAEWTYLLGQAFVSPRLKKVINEACDWESAAKNVPGSLSALCVALLNEASAEISSVNLYDIYGDCTSSICESASADKSKKMVSKVPIRPDLVVIDSNGGVEPPTRRVLQRIIPHGPDACINSKEASEYLNQPSVMSAIHVKDPGFCWSVCSTPPGWTYDSTRKNLPAETYPLLVSNIQVTIYNGDWDACVPYTDNALWTENMGFEVSSPWHAWTYTSANGNDNQVAGYSTVYDVSALGTGSFTFLTVKGGRHEVPASAPAQAFEMITRIVNNTPF